jgi:hypothetical protein
LGRSNTVNRVEDPDGEGRQLRLRSERTLTPSILVRIQVPQPGSRDSDSVNPGSNPGRSATIPFPRAR